MRIYAILILLLVALASGCICTSIDQNINTIQHAAETGDTTSCDAMDETLKYICYTTVATSTGNLTICEKIPSTEDNAGCYISVAVNTENIDVCDRIQIEEGRDSCILQVASRAGDKGLCSRLNNSETKIRNCEKSI